jgi:hypothetical protein
MCRLLDYSVFGGVGFWLESLFVLAWALKVKGRGPRLTLRSFVGRELFDSMVRFLVGVFVRRGLGFES